MNLYRFQEESVARIIAAIQAGQDPMLVAPTGSGKTVIISEVIRQSPNKHILFLAHRRELIHQARDKLSKFDVRAGVILAGEQLDQTRAVQVASVQTFDSSHIRGKTDLPHADIIIFDEAHHCRARTYQRIAAAYPQARKIGLTATPCRKDGRGLGGSFTELIETPQVAELIKLGHLVPTKVYAPSVPDLRDVKTSQGDYQLGDLQQAMDHGHLVADIVSTWHRHGERRPTVLFASGVAHSIHLCQEFRKTGVRAEHIDGQTPKDERDQILHLLASGDVELVSNAMVLTEGWDCPVVSCCILARPTKSMGLWRQMQGRVIRPHPGKTDAIILDHAGAVFRHGRVEDFVHWSLDPDTKATAPAQVARGQSGSTSNLLACTQCSAIRTAGLPCPNCGHMPRRPGRHLDVIDGDLALIDANRKIHPTEYSQEQKQEFYGGLLHMANSRGQKPGVAAHRYKDRFGEWPPFAWKQEGACAPTGEVLAWDRHCRIKYAKGMRARRHG